jgi:hypothetical protein
LSGWRASATTRRALDSRCCGRRPGTRDEAIFVPMKVTFNAENAETAEKTWGFSAGSALGG